MTAEPTSNAGPFHRLVILGDSIAYGMCAAQPENEWNQVLANLIRAFQDEPLQVYNRGLPAAVISPNAPGYEESAKPSLIERYRAHCIALQPDLVIIAEGLNDMRSGMPVQVYMSELAHMVGEIQQETGALVTLLGIYHQEFGCGANDPEEVPTWTRWDDDIAEVYNTAIRMVARKTGALFVDVRTAMKGASWMLNPDCCHLNDLGHVVVGNAVFQEIAKHCSALGAKTARIIAEQEIGIFNTGGADTDEEMRALWNAAAERFRATP